MAEINKPDVSNVWAAAGDVLKPSDSKILQGWSAEIPPRQWFNWWQNRTDSFIAHINQHGIPQWDASTEYQLNKSYVQGSDGIVYQAIQTNTNVNPVGNTTSWKKAFASSSDVPSVATAAQSRALTDNTVFISPAQLANAFSGANQNLSQSGFQKLPGGLKMAWGLATVVAGSNSVTVNFPANLFTTGILAVSISDTNDPCYSYGWSNASTTQMTVYAQRFFINSSGQISSRGTAIGSWMVIGV